MIGGGINTSESEEPVVVTQMLGVKDSAPNREAALRARFLSFDPLFDSASTLVAHQLVLRGRPTPVNAPEEVKRMNEDMLLTGVYSLTQDGLADGLPLLVRISTSVLFSDVPKQLHQKGLIWCVDIDNEQHMARALALQDAGLMFCPTLNRKSSIVRDSQSAWQYLNCHANDTPPKTSARLVVDGVQHARTQIEWPSKSWFKGSFFSGETQTAEINSEQALQLDLLSIALRKSGDVLAQFFRLNPAMEPRLLAIANSPVGGLSRPADSLSHALVMLGSQRSRRVAALLALAGANPTETSRQAAVTGLTRALFMGKIARLRESSKSAASAFEIGLLSTAPHALSMPVETLIRRLQLTEANARALSSNSTPEGALLQLAFACENNDVQALSSYAEELGIELQKISVIHLNAMIAASALDTALH